MKVDLSLILKDSPINKDKLSIVINDLVLYSLPQSELIKFIKYLN